MSPIDRYLHAVITRAQLTATDDGSATIEAPHLLLAVAIEPDPVVHTALAAHALDPAAIKAALAREFEHSLAVVGVSPGAYDLPRPSRLPARPQLGTSAKLTMERIVTTRRRKDLRPAHLLLALLAAEVGTVPRALALAGVDRAELIARVERELAGTPG